MQNSLPFKIKAARLAADLTQDDVARALRISRGAVTAWERPYSAKKTRPRVDRMQILAELTGVPVQFFLDERYTVDDLPQMRQPRAMHRVFEIVAPDEETNDAPRRQLAFDAPEEEPVHRQAQRFWSAVEYLVCEENPALEDAFYYQRPQQEARHRAPDFFNGRTVVEFIALRIMNGEHRMRQACGDVMIAAHLLHAKRRAICCWSSDDLPPEMIKRVASLGEQLDIDVQFFSSPKACAEYLLSL